MRPTLQRLSMILVLAALPWLATWGRSQSALPISPAAIDATVTRAMKAFQVPGMAVGIIKDGKLVYAKGYGVRELGKPAQVDADTLFQIGSNTKAFTTAALAMLVDEGKIHWDDRVIDYLPQFRMYDPYVTREFRIRDLLTHRSGLGLGAGDLMFFPATDFTRDEIIHGLRYLKPVSGFRSKFDYDNLLYMVAGQIIPAVTGKSWEDFVTQRILDPLQMRPCAATYDRIPDHSDVAAPHVVVKGELKAIPVVQMDAVGPAGTINCSINGMAKWIETQLAAGKTPGGQQLFSAQRSEEMWTMNTIIPLSPLLSSMYRTHFNGYALGWGVEDLLGYKKVAHTGGVLGSGHMGGHDSRTQSRRAGVYEPGIGRRHERRGQSDPGCLLGSAATRLGRHRREVHRQGRCRRPGDRRRRSQGCGHGGFAVAAARCVCRDV